MFIDPLSFTDGIERISQHYAISNDRRILVDIPQGDLVSLRNIAQRYNARQKFRPLLDILHSNRNIIFFIDLDVCTHNDTLLLTENRLANSPAGFGSFISLNKVS